MGMKGWKSGKIWTSVRQILLITNQETEGKRQRCLTFELHIKSLKSNKAQA